MALVSSTTTPLAPVCRDIFSDSVHTKLENDAKKKHWCLFRSILESDDITRLENLILRFSLAKMLPPIALVDCLPLLFEAQSLLLNGQYGIAIARFKSILLFIQTITFTDSEEHLPIAAVLFVRGLVHERIAFCQLLKNNPVLAIKHSQLCIAETPHHHPMSHLWRAIGYRRRKRPHAALKSMTLYVAASAVNPNACAFLEHEQCVINQYWKAVSEESGKKMTNVKTLYISVPNLSHLDLHQQAEAMSQIILEVNPTFNCLIHSEAGAVHWAPLAGTDVSFFASTVSHRQAYSFREPDAVARYFAKLPQDIEWDLAETRPFNLRAAREVWEAAAFINATSPHVSIDPGGELHEHLLYCMELTKEQQWHKALFEFGALLADLALFPLLSSREWTREDEAEADEFADKVSEIVRVIRNGIADSAEETSGIAEITLWLEHCERQFRVRQSKVVPTSLSTARRKYVKKKVKKAPRECDL